MCIENAIPKRNKTNQKGRVPPIYPSAVSKKKRGFLMKPRVHRYLPDYISPSLLVDHITCSVTFPPIPTRLLPFGLCSQSTHYGTSPVPKSAPLHPIPSIICVQPESASGVNPVFELGTSTPSRPISQPGGIVKAWLWSPD